MGGVSAADVPDTLILMQRAVANRVAARPNRGEDFHRKRAAGQPATYVRS